MHIIVCSPTAAKQWRYTYINQKFKYSSILFDLQKPSDHVDGLIDDILQHVPGVINATSSAIGIVADRFITICGGGSSNQRADSGNVEANKRAGDKRVRTDIRRVVFASGESHSHWRCTSQNEEES